jgi:hypothetical protein
MAMNNFSSDDAPQTPAIRKKPYEKPTFRYEQVFVTSALSCGKFSATQGQCAGSMKVS